MDKGTEKTSYINHRYRTLQLLQQTENSRIYLVEDTHRFNETCLLKAFNSHVTLAQFQRESRLLYRLHHPQIPRFREAFQISGQFFLVEDYIPGKTYQELLQSRCLNEKEVTEFLEKFFPILEYLQGQGIIHGQICPENILCRQGDLLPCLVDFSQSQEQSQPENQVNAMDLRDLATTLLVLLTGKKATELVNSPDAWQKQVLVGSRLNHFLGKILLPKNSLPNAVMVSAPPDPSQKVATQPITPIKKSIVGWGCWLQTLLWSSFALGFGSLGWMGAKLWLAKMTPIPPPPVFPSPTISPFSTPAPLSTEQQEWQTQADLRSRRQQQGINSQFFQSLLDQVLQKENPSLVAGTPAEIRSKRDQKATQLLDSLENLSEKGRQQLGSYTHEQLKAWTEQINELHLSSRALYDLTDGAFFHAFPQETQQPALDQPLGQVWAAFAEDVLEKLNLGDRYEEIVVDSSSDVIERQGFLQPGEGQAYLISLEAGQKLEIDLDADQSTLLSVYSPTGRHNLLEDSPDSHWSGTLPETGLYELTIVSKSSQSLSYQLNLKLNSSTPK